MLWYLIHAAAIAVSVGGVAFFAGSETSFVSSNRFRVRVMAKRGHRGAATARWLLDRPATLLSVTLVGTNVFVVLASALATDLLNRTLGSYSVVVSTVGVTAILLVFGEIIPKAVARSTPERFLAGASAALGVAYYVLYPVARVTSAAALSLVRLAESVERSGSVTREEIRALVKEAAQANLDLGSYSQAHRVLDLSRMKVTEAMRPMDEVVCIDEGVRVREALKVAAASGHSRYPVYKRTPDNIVGVLHLKDLLGVPIESRVKVFVRGGYFVPETKIVKEALREMRDELKHMGIIADEYGRPIGILTFEDLVEEITGEILDEYDHAAGERLGFGIAISGNTPISVLNEQMETHIPRGAYGTVAGFILDRSGRMSRPGDVVEYGDLRFHVLEVKRRRIKTVRITKRKEGNEEKVDSGN